MVKNRGKMEHIDLFNHYQKLWFFNFNRFKDNNYQLMQQYFAQILIIEIEEYIGLSNKKVLDVGGSGGEFCKILSTERRCDAINLDTHICKDMWPKSTIALAESIPFRDDTFDLVICRGVLEHIQKEKQQQSVEEMYRVTKSGGICYILIPPWYNPHAGHQLKPFHIFPFKTAKYLRQLFFGEKINADSFQEADLFPITFNGMSKMISLSNFTLVSTKDTHFRLHFLTTIPIIRELFTPAVAFILRKNKD